MLLGTALLAVLGFGLGIVAGLVLEEPGLLLRLRDGQDAAGAARRDAQRERVRRSRAREGAIPDAAPAAAAVRTASRDAAARSEAAAPRRAKSSPRRARGRGAPPQVAAAPPSAPDAEQPAEPPATAEAKPDRRRGRADGADAHAAGARSAQRLLGAGRCARRGARAPSSSRCKLRKRGFPVYVAPSAEPGSKRWRVRVGPVATREKADELADRLEREKLPTWVLAEGPR